MVEPPATNPGHWVQCPECQRFFENEQGRGSHRLHSHNVRGGAIPANGGPHFAARSERSAPPETPTPAPSAPASPPTLTQQPPPALEPKPTEQAPVRPKAPTQTTLNSGSSPPPSAQDFREIDWSDPKSVPTGLAVISQSLAQTRPPPTMGTLGRGVVVLIVFALSGLALYLVVQQLKGASAPPPQPYIIDAARIQPGAPRLTTGDAYWDSVLGYRGMRL